MLHVADEVVGHLLGAVIVHHGVGDDGPSVAQVPPDDARLPGLVATPHLHEELHGLGLDRLRGEDEVLQLARHLAEEQADLVQHKVVPGEGLALFGEAADGLGEPFLVPLVALLPGVDAFGRHHAAQALLVGAAVVADFADEGTGGLGVERVLVVAARAPEVVFGPEVLAAAVVVDGLADIRRAGQIGPRRVELIDDGGDGAAGDFVAVGVDAEGPQAPSQRDVVLVVAAPEGDAGVVPQLRHHGGDLPADALLEVGALGVEGAAHREVLPYQDALGVAYLEELVVLIHVAAPAADHVAVHVHGHLQHVLHLCRVAAVQGVDGHPVGAVDEDVLAVHHEVELARLLRQVHVREVELHGAQSDAARVLGQHRAGLVHQFQFGVVQRRLAIAARPPQVGVLNLDGAAHGGHHHRLGGGVDLLAVAREGVAGLHPAELLEGHGHLGLHVHGGAARVRVGEVSHVMHVAQPDGLLHAQFHVAPQARAHQSGQDVPPEPMRRLAGVHALRGRIAADAERAEQLLLAGDDRRAQNHLHAVLLAGLHHVRHVERVFNHHVLRRAHRLAVHPHVGQAVDAAEPQHEPLSGFRLRRGELPRVAPLEALPGPQVVHVAAHHRVLNQPRLQQVQFHIARHRGRNPLRLHALHCLGRAHRLRRLLPVIQFPLAVERRHVIGKRANAHQD